MTSRGSIHFFLLIALVFAAGCASSPRSTEQSTTQAVIVSQEGARQLSFSYRTQARDLRELAPAD